MLNCSSSSSSSRSNSRSLFNGASKLRFRQEFVNRALKLELERVYGTLSRAKFLRRRAGWRIKIPNWTEYVGTLTQAWFESWQQKWSTVTFSSWSRPAVAASGRTRVSTAWAGRPSLQLSLHTSVTVARHDVFSCLPTRHSEKMILLTGPEKKIPMCIALPNKLQNCHTVQLTAQFRVCRDPPQPLVCVCLCTIQSNKSITKWQCLLGNFVFKDQINVEWFSPGFKQMKVAQETRQWHIYPELEQWWGSMQTPPTHTHTLHSRKNK